MSATGPLMSKRTGTDGSLLTSLPWTLGALAFSVIPHLQFLPIWVTVIFVACSAWRLQVERKRWRLPPAWTRIVLSLVCFIGVLASYESVSGVGPGSALLAVMAALKLLETKQRRDQFVLLFISIFLIMSSLLREQFLWSLPYLMVGVLFTLTAWLRMSDARPIGFGQSIRTGGRLVAYAIPLMITMWVFFPRIATPFWSVPIDTSSASSGLSDNMSPGDISSLSLSNAVAFRVDFEGDAPPQHELYWRGLVLQRFNGRTWTGFEPSRGSRARDSIEYLGDPVAYQVTMEPTRQHWVIGLDVPNEWDRGKRIFMARQQQLARDQPIDQRITYNAVSYTDFRLNNELSQFERDRYLSLPENSNPRTLELARSMREEAGSSEVFINQVLMKFNREEYFYTLEPPPLGSNPVDRFLFDTRQGFCEHYASAFAVMMRAAGIPSRVVLGYQGGEVNPMGEYMIVRQADAHAWNEVWLPRRGWYRVDPTGAVAPERIEEGRSGAMFDGIGATWGLNAPSEFLYQLTMTWDAMNTKWNEWILAYGPDNQGKFMEWLGMEDPDWRKMMLTLVIVVVLLTVLISVLLIMRYRPPPKDDAARLYRKFTKATGVEPEIGETPFSYFIRLTREKSGVADKADDITSLYLDARYGPPEPASITALQNAVSDFSRSPNS
jgi:transglutaminase-like putative cysteine protease